MQKLGLVFSSPGYNDLGVMVRPSVDNVHKTVFLHGHQASQCSRAPSESLSQRICVNTRIFILILCAYKF
jgi:hypothetical protein